MILTNYIGNNSISTFGGDLRTSTNELGGGVHNPTYYTQGDDQILEATPQTFTEFNEDFLFLGIYPLQS